MWQLVEGEKSGESEAGASGMKLHEIWIEYQENGDYKLYNRRLKDYWSFYNNGYPTGEHYNPESVKSDR